jgi:hypothetical protein
MHMKAIVADSAGTGQLIDKDGVAHDLDPQTWAETDVRDTIVTGDGQMAWVAYRDDGHTVEVPANTTYHIEYKSDDVIDVRTGATAAEELFAAMDGVGTDEERIYAVLGSISGQPDKIAELRLAFQTRAGRSLDDALADEMSGDELERALAYLR